MDTRNKTTMLLSLLLAASSLLVAIYSISIQSEQNTAVAREVSRVTRRR
jgi:hypothetical protein